jgi:tetratricopeptide (TPR) repeat protein
MATESGKRSAVAATLAASLMIAGCNAIAPVRFISAPDRASAAQDGDLGPIVTVIKGTNAPLPRQGYNAAGEKVAYEPDANPYTSTGASVPPEAKTLFQAARWALENGDLKRARAQYEAMTTKYPKLSGPWVKLGVIAEKNEQLDAAVKHYQTAIKVNNRNVNAYVALALLQRKRGKFVEAQKAYLDALAVWKDFPEAHLNLAILYDLYMNRPDYAQKHYEAYEFLTGGKRVDVHKWLVEVRQRTGIKQSFIDIPPKAPVTVAKGAAEAAK